MIVFFFNDYTRWRTYDEIYLFRNTNRTRKENASHNGV